MIDLISGVLWVVRASCRRHGDLVAENLLLRHQLAVLTRPTRRRRVRFRRLDKLLWVLIHLAVTAHPTAAWVWRQVVEATPWGRRPKHLIRDRDRVYGHDFGDRAKALGIDTVLTPVRAPRANAIAKRVIGTLRRECLDHVIPLDERHLGTILAEYAQYYNTERPHRTLRLETPRPATRSPTGAVVARPVLGGLHHAYGRAA